MPIPSILGDAFDFMAETLGYPKTLEGARYYLAECRNPCDDKAKPASNAQIEFPGTGQAERLAGFICPHKPIS